MVNQNIVRFIKEARKRGFSDPEIKRPLLKQGWPESEVDSAFASLEPKQKHKEKLIIYIDSDILKQIEKRAKKNYFTISEQIEDILRRSTLRTKTKATLDNIDDLLLSIFSRKRYKKKN